MGTMGGSECVVNEDIAELGKGGLKGSRGFLGSLDLKQERIKTKNKMKKIFTPLLLAAVVSFAGCNKKNLLDIKFGMNAKEIEFTSPAAPNPGEMNFLIQNLKIFL